MMFPSHIWGSQVRPDKKSPNKDKKENGYVQKLKIMLFGLRIR